MQLTLLDDLTTLPAASWNALAGDDNPFLRHEFLAALERHHCVGEQAGWWPQHLLVEEEGQLLGAVPMYLKNNSYGEFVFDWDWAEAYERNGLRYYPKLVVAIPYTPTSGPRLLVADGAQRDSVANLLIQGALEHAHHLKLCSGARVTNTTGATPVIAILMTFYTVFPLTNAKKSNASAATWWKRV
ncbi:MAG: hypothetical protein FD130_874 [Halothiobacillaceae bacterium]|nr:MAG: hypothetical protein FD130_874 [Halothiobacillaceae bacterium]